MLKLKNRELNERLGVNEEDNNNDMNRQDDVEANEESSHGFVHNFLGSFFFGQVIVVAVIHNWSGTVVQYLLPVRHMNPHSPH